MSNWAACGAEVASTDRFCSQCGAPQVKPCPGCGAENPPGHRFCPACGTPLSDAAARTSPTVSQSVSERRLVSVLFADLVGFTTLSEHRDPEEVRELLSNYFDRSRAVIGRYGGTVEKFIGDAVMAVWGAPVAQEDDAERAVRAALDLVEAVAALGEEVRAPDLAARAGVLTGTAAVNLGAKAALVLTAASGTVRRRRAGTTGLCACGFPSRTVCVTPTGCSGPIAPSEALERRRGGAAGRASEAGAC